MTYFPVIYQWIGEDGLTHYGNSVCDGETKVEAENKFFRQHPHVKPVYDRRLIPRD